VAIDLNRFNRNPDVSSRLVQLMILCNDLITANTLFGDIEARKTSVPSCHSWGAGLYLVRLQHGHLHEAVSLLKSFRSCGALELKCYETLAIQVVDWITRVEASNKRLSEYLAQIRNNTIFHYDRRRISTVLKDLASRSPRNGYRVTRSNDVRLARYSIADRVIDELTVGKIFNLDIESDRRIGSDEIMTETFDLYKHLLWLVDDLVMAYMKYTQASV
jgi:hypothetical protein